jgi:hypothetical protein
MEGRRLTKIDADHLLWCRQNGYSEKIVVTDKATRHVCYTFDTLEQLKEFYPLIANKDGVWVFEKRIKA